MNRLAQPHGTMVLRDVAPSPLERAIEGYTRKMDDELGGEVFRASGSASPLLLKVLERGGWVGEVGSEHAPDPVRLMAGAQRRRYTCRSGCSV